MILLRNARLIIEQFEAAQREIRGSAAEPSGEVRLGLPSTISQILGVPLILAARLQFPKVTLRIAEAMSATCSTGCAWAASTSGCSTRWWRTASCARRPAHRDAGPVRPGLASGRATDAGGRGDHLRRDGGAAPHPAEPPAMACATSSTAAAAERAVRLATDIDIDALRRHQAAGSSAAWAIRCCRPMPCGARSARGRCGPGTSPRGSAAPCISASPWAAHCRRPPRRSRACAARRCTTSSARATGTWPQMRVSN